MKINSKQWIVLSTLPSKNGLLDFQLKQADKLFLSNQQESYGGQLPILKVVEYSNCGIPFSELNESLNPAFELRLLCTRNYCQVISMNYR